MTAKLTADLGTDASRDIGGGHGIGCLTPANGLIRFDWSCTLACRKGIVETGPALGDYDCGSLADLWSSSGCADEELRLPLDSAGWPHATVVAVVSGNSALKASSRSHGRHIRLERSLAADPAEEFA